MNCTGKLPTFPGEWRHMWGIGLRKLSILNINISSKIREVRLNEAQIKSDY
jgi:hypothetical protein